MNKDFMITLSTIGITIIIGTFFILWKSIWNLKYKKGKIMLDASFLINLFKKPKKDTKPLKLHKIKSNFKREKFKIKDGRITTNVMRFSVYQEMYFNEILNKVLHEQDGCKALNYLPDSEVFDRCIEILEILKSKEDEESIKQYKFILSVLKKLRYILNNKL